jgi:hypothetical protein
METSRAVGDEGTMADQATGPEAVGCRGLLYAPRRASLDAVASCCPVTREPHRAVPDEPRRTLALSELDGCGWRSLNLNDVGATARERVP